MCANLPPAKVLLFSAATLWSALPRSAFRPRRGRLRPRGRHEFVCRTGPRDDAARWTAIASRTTPSSATAARPRWSRATARSIGCAGRASTARRCSPRCSTRARRPLAHRAVGAVRGARRYLPDTNVLETAFAHAGGELRRSPTSCRWPPKHDKRARCCAPTTRSCASRAARRGEVELERPTSMPRPGYGQRARRASATARPARPARATRSDGVVLLAPRCPLRPRR